MLIEAPYKSLIISERAAPSVSRCAGGEASIILPLKGWFVNAAIHCLGGQTESAESKKKRLSSKGKS